MPITTSPLTYDQLKRYIEKKHTIKVIELPDLELLRKHHNRIMGKDIELVSSVHAYNAYCHGSKTNLIYLCPSSDIISPLRALAHEYFHALCRKAEIPGKYVLEEQIAVGLDGGIDPRTVYILPDPKLEEVVPNDVLLSLLFLYHDVEKELNRLGYYKAIEEENGL